MSYFDCYPDPLTEGEITELTRTVDGKKLLFIAGMIYLGLTVAEARGLRAHNINGVTLINDFRSCAPVILLPSEYTQIRDKIEIMDPLFPYSDADARGLIICSMETAGIITRQFEKRLLRTAACFHYLRHEIKPSEYMSEKSILEWFTEIEKAPEGQRADYYRVYEKGSL